MSAMRGFILAAGLGTRLKPWTERTPKPLVPVGGEPLVERALRQFAAAGVREVGVNLHHLGEQIADQVGDGARCGVRVTWFDERPHILGTGGGLKNAEGFLRASPSGAFLLANADVWHDFDLGDVVRAHRPQALATMVVHRLDRRPELHNVWVQASPAGGTTGPLALHDPLLPVVGASHVQTGRIRSIAGAPVAPGAADVPTIYTGVAVYGVELLDWLPMPTRQSGLVSHALVPAMAIGREVRFFEPRGHWFDCGTPAEVLRASAHALRARESAALSPALAQPARLTRSTARQS
ncbi:MAG: hypothetical protein EXR79_07195 [Myxococcales bacterium]|nr:hypothetical protein [Myxococcales bacterium]